MSSRIIAQADEKWSAATDLEGARARDRFMAENAAWLLEQAGPGAKMVLWAHNGHIGGAPWGWPPVVVPRMGTHLKERYGEALILCGFAFYAGGCVAYAPGGVALQVHQVPPPPADSYEAAFRQAGLPHLFLDLRGLRSEAPATAWLAGPRGLRYIGAGYDAAQPDAYVVPVSLPRQFDLVLYVEGTTPSHPLFPFGPPADTAAVMTSSAVTTGLAG